MSSIQPLCFVKNSAVHFHSQHDMALKLLMQAKIACANSIHDLETLDGVTDDWPSDDETLMNNALELHLHSEATAKECHAIIDIADALIADGNAAKPAEKLLEMVSYSAPLICLHQFCS